ncbi:unnamed protein product [Brassicogethes aeneus]|uniref:Protein BCCIP homolog n=1 Tax=Brassicogethes aeneus TaxID=1431903 RepID=A0A9P0B5G0_BRAAE|nr:unnamed protein product [Brassicogethes aeneus]CAH0555586.1 unnamed protein product [Brassicogethes aeneus]
MAGPTKKTKPTEKEESEEEVMSEDEESEEGTYHGQNEVQATFEGRNPEGQDFHGIKQLLVQLFLKAHIDLSQISDMLIQQNGVGSVLKQSYNDSDDEEDVDMVEESDVFGITSVLNLTSHRETPCVVQLYKLLEEVSGKHSSNEVQENIKKILQSSNRLGFLINERFVNIPAKISTVMLTSLHDEIERFKKKDQSYNFQYFVMICKTYKPKGEKDGEETFTNAEEEIFAKKSIINFEFNVENEADSGLAGKWLSEDKQVTPFRRVLIFKADKFKNIIDEVTAFVQ